MAKISQTATGASDARNTVGTVILGTPAYMAPEQCRGLSRADGKADVYALGAMLHEMLTGQPPFSGSSAADLIALHITKEPPELSSLRPAVRPELSALARRMLDKDPEKRPSMQRVVIEITEIGTRPLQVSVAIKPVDTASSPQKTPAKMPPKMIAVLIGIAALICGVGALLYRGGLGFLVEHRRPEMVRLVGGSTNIGSTLVEIEAAFQWCQQLGTEGCQKERFQREHPTHSVRLSPYFLDSTEVDNAHFAAWLNQNKALRVDEKRILVYQDQALVVDLYNTYGNGGIVYAGDKFSVLRGYEHRPVTQVSWDGADAYCRAQDKRLPTEAEWEYAARSGQAYRFPWGDDEPRCEGTVFARNKGWTCGHLVPGTQPVATSAQDRSRQGIYDLAGNVSEWVQDGFAAHGYYAACDPPCKDPRLDASSDGAQSELRVVRGGDWFSPAWVSRSAGRSRVAHSYVSSNLGFRCAKSAVF